MKQYTTQLRAISATTGQLTTYCGPNVPAISIETAQQYCEANGLGYCVVTGELVAEISCKKDSNKPDWDAIKDYENINLN